MNKFIKKFFNFFQIKNYFRNINQNHLNILTLLKNSRIVIKGKENSLLIKKGNLKRIKIGIYGKNNLLEIDNDCFLRDTNIIINGSNLKVIIKENCEIGGLHIVCAGENSSIIIDKNCLLASDIEIRNNDGHSILMDGKVINQSKDIFISNNVWICQNVKILKGSNIGSNSVIALNSIVTKGIYPPNIILAGSPAKIIRKDIIWKKERPS